jgi:nucleotide-binding universal stress UspA family protein
MFEKILLPLDGSQLAEAAIPYVRHLAEQLDAEIYIVHACPSEHQYYVHMHQIYVNSIKAGILQQISDSWKANKAHTIQAEVVVGEPIKVVFDFAKLKGINLIALTTHGNSGFKPWSMGSVADKIVRGGGIPTLLIRVKEQKDMELRRADINRILAPLDSSDSSKASLPYAVTLAKKLQADITLFTIAQTAYAQNLYIAGSGIGVNWDSVDKASEKAAVEYLQKVEDELKDSGVKIDHVSRLGVDPAFEILEMEKKGDFDMVVMATRGRSSIARWAFGSVAEKVLREGNLPILLIKESKDKN